MTIFITGDTHGWNEIRNRFHKHTMPAKQNDTVIVLGDFGMPWIAKDQKGIDARIQQVFEKETIDILTHKPYDILFIDGNHENFDILDKLPIKNYNGAPVGVLADNVYHLLRGQCYTIEDMTLFCMGGATSIDKICRTPHVSWWPQEIPNKQERAQAIKTLKAINYQCDVILTHCPPTNELYRLSTTYDINPIIDEFENWLETEIAQKTTFKSWLYGHMHINDECKQTPYTALYNEIVQLNQNGIPKPLR